MLNRSVLAASLGLSLLVGCAALPEEEVGEGQGAATTSSSSSSGGTGAREAAPIATMAEAQDRFAEAKCLQCHGFEKKVVGPSFRTLAKDYADRLAKRSTTREKDALREQMITRYVKSVTRGSQWNWELSGVPMPANTEVTSAEARRLIEFVLDLPAP